MLNHQEKLRVHTGALKSLPLCSKFPRTKNGVQVDFIHILVYTGHLDMIEKLFTTPVYVKDLDLNNKSIYNECIRYQKEINKKGCAISNRGGYQSPNLLTSNIPAFDNLAKMIADHVKIYGEYISLYPKHLKDLWFNINHYKDYNVTHDHFGEGNKFSGVYYVKTPRNSGVLKLYHPGVRVVDSAWSRYSKQHNEFTSSCWNYEAKQGRLIIFPSWLEHGVEPNFSKLPRVSFSFNVE